MIKKWILIWLLGSIASPAAFCQNPPQYGFDLVYSNFYFENSSEFNFNLIHSVYADSALIITAISGNRSEISNPANVNFCTYLSFHHLNGDQVSVKKLSFPGQNANNDMSSFRYTQNIAKINANKYVVGLSGYDTTLVPGENRYHPLFYLFNRNGDSLRLIDIPADTNVRFVQSVSSDKFGNMIACIKQDNDHYIIHESPDSVWLTGYGFSDIRMVKMNSMGDIIWQKNIPETWSISTNNEPYSLCVSPDGLRYTVFYNNNFKPWVIQMDSSGQVIWNKEIPHKNPADTSSYYSAAYLLYMVRGCIDQQGRLYYVMKDSKPYITPNGDTQNNSSCLHYGRLDTNGDTLWTRTFDVPGGGNDYRMDVCNMAAMNNGDIIIALPYYQYTKQQANALVLRADSTGHIKWHRNILRFAERTGHFLGPLSISPDQKIVLGGGFDMYSLPEEQITDPIRKKLNGYATSWLVMLDSLGRRCEADTIAYDGVPDCGPQPSLIEDTSASPSGSYRVYPNPASATLTVELPQWNNQLSGTEIRLYDLQGRLLLRKTMTAFRENINISGLSCGMYILRLVHKGKALYATKVLKL
jgi:hypothetical protein